MQTHAARTHSGYAHNATTAPRVVHSLAELQMALADKARGQRIAQLRKRRRLTQQAMAERLQIAYRTYQTWESGTMPEWSNIEKLAEFFSVKPEYLIGDGDIAGDPNVAPQIDRIEALLIEQRETISGLRAVVDELREENRRAQADLEVLAAEARRRSEEDGRAKKARARRPPRP